MEFVGNSKFLTLKKNKNAHFFFSTKNLSDEDYNKILSEGKCYHLKLHKIVFCREQIHSDIIFIYPDNSETESDGIITRCKGIAIGIKVADCAAVSLYDPIKGIIGIFHCGWRGLSVLILEKALSMMKKMGVKENDIHAVIYPHICGDCYEVGEDVAYLFGNNLLYNYIKRKDGKIYLSLENVIKSQLRAKGIFMFYSTSYCTYHDEDLFYSYRREGDAAGRMLALAVVK